MTFRSALVTLAGSMGLVTVLGAGLGGALGTLAPDYYRAVCSGGHEPKFDPLAAGLLLGTSQGAAAGFVAGLGAVAALCVRDARGAGPTAGRGSRWALIAAAAGAGLVVGACLGFAAGFLGGIGSVHRGRYDEEREAVAPILAADPAFVGVAFHERSSGGIYLSGTVPTAADRERLAARLTQAVGETRANECLIAVSVPPTAAEPRAAPGGRERPDGK